MFKFQNGQAMSPGKLLMQIQACHHCLPFVAEYTSNVENLFYGFIFTVLLDGPVFAFNTTSPPVYPHYVFISPENRLWAKFFVS